VGEARLLEPLHYCTASYSFLIIKEMITITNLTSETFYPTLQKNLKESIGRMRSDSNVFPKCFKITK
jgi:predicted DNA-binding transcriptional regulator AlpA